MKSNYRFEYNFLQVTYDVIGFLEKNRDTLSANLLETMRNSESQMVCDLFTAPLSKYRCITDQVSKTFPLNFSTCGCTKY